MLDAGDIYTAGLNFNMVSILSEVYNLGKPEYYVVAVAKARDAETELIYLKNKNTCHTGNNFQSRFAYYIYLLYFLVYLK